MHPRSLAAILSFLLVFAQVSFAADAPGTSKSLVNAKRFSVGGVGNDGKISGAEIACRKIVLGDDPASVFAEILEHGTPAAKMYALCGVYFTNPEIYRKLVVPYRKSHDPVDIVEGCSLGRSTYENLIRNLEAKRYEELSKALPKR